MSSTSASATRSRALCLFAALALAAPAGAKVFYTQQEALALAFPDAESVEARNWVLTDEQAGRIEALSRSKLDSKLVRVWRATRGDVILGWALIDVRTVRTHAEAFMVVLTPEGKVASVRMLAFHEPLDYLPSERWTGQFANKGQDDPLRVGSDIHGIAGATLSARATTEGVRRALAIHQVLLAGER